MPFQSSAENAVKSNTEININQRWIEFKKIILNSAQDHKGHERKTRLTKPWITQGMISKMDERRKWINKNHEGKKRYKQLINDLRRETKQEKDVWWNKEC